MISNLPKITALEEEKTRTIYLLDEDGNRYRDTEEIIVNRKVKTVETSKRFLHYLIDFTIITLIYKSINMFNEYISYNFNTTFLKLFSIFGTFSYPFLFGTMTYYLFFEFLTQRTPGKFITRTVVIDEYGNKPEFTSILLRSLIRYIPFEALSCLDEKESYGWHDKWSKTWVVTYDELKKIKQLQLENIKNN